MIAIHGGEGEGYERLGGTEDSVRHASTRLPMMETGLRIPHDLPRERGRQQRLRHLLAAGVLGGIAIAAVVLLVAWDGMEGQTTGLRELLMTDAKLQELLEVPKKIHGVRQKVKQIIASGKWSDEAIKLDLQYGLLPSPYHSAHEEHDGDYEGVRTVDPNHLGDGSGRAGAQAPMVVSPHGDSTSIHPVGMGDSVTGGSNSTGGGLEGAVRANGTSQGFHEPDDFMVQGHCMMEPNKRCTEDANCEMEGGGCIFWHCTADPGVRCMSDMDCSSRGGVCTGPGHCSEKPRLPCYKDSNCVAYGGACILTGFCAAIPSRTCTKESDCGDSGGGCRTKPSVWFQVDENFPKNPDFGPFQNWTKTQLHEKLLVLVLKILHLQHDLESQVPINTEFLENLRDMQTNGALDADANRKNLTNTTSGLESDFDSLSHEIKDDSANLNSDVSSLGDWLTGANREDEVRLKTMSEDKMWQRVQDMLASLFLRTHLLEHAINTTAESWDKSEDPIIFEGNMNLTVNSAVRRTASKLTELIHEYSIRSRSHYQDGYRKLLQHVKRFMFFTNSHLRKSSRHMKQIRRRIRRWFPRRFRKMERLENRTFDDQASWLHDGQSMANASEVLHAPIQILEKNARRILDNENPTAGFVARFYNVHRRMDSMPNFGNLSAEQEAMVSHPKAINYRSHADFLLDAPDLVDLDDDEVAAVFSGVIHIDKGGIYYFSTRSDDGSHLWIDNKMVVNNEGLHPPVTQEGFIHLNPGYYDFKADFFENHGGEYMVVKYRGPDTKDRDVLLKGLRSVPGASDLHPGFIGRFYSLEHKDGQITHMPGLSDLEPEAVSYSKFIDLPSHDDFLKEDPRIPLERVAAEWTGVVHVELAGEYTFSTASDDGSHLWINGVMIVNNGGLHPVEERHGMIYLDPGYHDFRADFFENHGGEAMIVQYKGPDTKGNMELVTGFHRGV